MIIFYTTLFLSNNLGLLLHKVIAVTPITFGRTGLILFGGGGGGGGGTVLVCPTALLTQYTNATLFEILSGPFLRIFPWRGDFLKKEPFCEIIY
jgi:hypothetical protein